MITGTSRLSIVNNRDGTATLSWIDGTHPFQLQKTSDLKEWQNVGRPTIATRRLISLTEQEQAFFRLQEAIPLLDIDLEYEPGTRLVWDVPDLE